MYNRQQIHIPENLSKMLSFKNSIVDMKSHILGQYVRAFDTNFMSSGNIWAFITYLSLNSNAAYHIDVYWEKINTVLVDFNGLLLKRICCIVLMANNFTYLSYCKIRHELYLKIKMHVIECLDESKQMQHRSETPVNHFIYGFGDISVDSCCYHCGVVHYNIGTRPATNARVSYTTSNRPGAY